jgi:hypothetical protein
MEKVYFHIAAFEANKLVSLRPETFDLGPFSHLHTEAFERLWRTVFRKVWAQWRYENGLPDYHGPAFIGNPSASTPPAVEVNYGPCEVLSFCGGGKDSLVAMKLLERAGVPFASYAYSHSLYGSAAHQHELIEGLLGHVAASCHHRHWVYDDFMDSPVVELHTEYGVKTILAAETPSSVFGVIPVILQHGYRHIVLAHERSADVGNMTWEQTGEEINHQWGKSLEAELLLDDYIKRELIKNVSYFSILKPVYDVLIFNLLARDPGAVPHTHSCNVRKPWCGRCPKCAYVWLNYMAYLPTEMVNGMFGQQNLFDADENHLWFRQMLGLEAHTPFECIGQIQEARLAFALCRSKGLGGRAMDVFTSEVPGLELESTLDSYLSVEGQLRTPPPDIFDAVLPQMLEAAEAARSYIKKTLSHE